MKDITIDIKNAAAKDVPWSFNNFFDVLDLLKLSGFEISFCDEDDEKWAQINLNKQQVGYIWKRYPLIFISTGCADSVQHILRNYDYIVYIEGVDMVTNLYKINYAEVTDILNYGMDNDSFSACDMWFCNILG